MKHKAKQRIVLVARSLQMGGVERNTVNLANALVSIGHEVHIVVLKNRRDLVADPAVYVHVFDMDKLHRLTGVGLVYDLLTRGLLRLFMPRSSFFWRGLYGGFYFRLWLVRLERKYGPVDKVIARGQGAFEHLWSFSDPRFFCVVVSPHGEPRGSALEKLYTRAIYDGKHLIVNSSGTEASLRKRLATYDISARDITLIPNPIPIERIRRLAEEPARLPEKPYLLHVGRLTFQKNQELLLRAYHASGVEQELVIIGSGEEEQALHKLAHDLGLQERVIFIGQQQNPYPWMKNAQLFILSSRIEGFGLVIVESLICGTPVVAVDCPGGIRDILTGDQAHLIAEPTEQGLAQKIRKALEQPIDVRPEWYERFDAEHIAREFLSLDA